MDKLENATFEVQWAAERPFQVVGLGLNAVDWIYVIPRYPVHGGKVEIENVYKRGGGQVATASALCARYGLKVRYVGRVGDDAIGKFSLDDLRVEPMDISCVDEVPGASSQFATILVDRPTGERTILWNRDSRLLYRDGELDREQLVIGQLLHLDGHDQVASIQAARWAREVGMKVSLDIDKVQPGVEELLGITDFLIPSVNFVCKFSSSRDWRRGLMELAEHTDGFVGLTRGSKGAAALWEGDIFEIPSVSVECVDTTGAGDVFHGAFIYALLENYSVGECLRFANTAAALSCTQYGARRGIPPREEVFSMLNHG
ncbi:MAG: PfkB family carbohydrate kinase [Acidobacteriota bacterium]|nr:PfkB family carbohydrate kinase [Acidobacteriota bacterium]